MDRYTKDVRSRMMRAVRREDTRPERAVRSELHALGFRFRLHRRDLPGSPDIVLPRHRVCILVHGCFWHRHPGCRLATTPASNVAFWTEKFARNVERDDTTFRLLEAAGWRTVTVWECETRRPDALRERLLQLLPDRGRS